MYVGVDHQSVWLSCLQGFDYGMSTFLPTFMPYKSAGTTILYSVVYLILEQFLKVVCFPLH